MADRLPTLTPELWARVRDIFSEIGELSAVEQTASLGELSRSDPAAAAHIAAMLAAADVESPLDRPIETIADELLSHDALRLWDQQFGPYRLVRLIGRGGMGIVYLGHRDDLGAPAAIKILLNAWIDPARTEQFNEEMRILAALSHVSIAGLLHAGQLEDGTPWFAMQYVEGVPITQWVWDKNLPVDDILRLFDTLCAAVAFAHAHPIVHRDLKPSNILVTHDGAVKLLDFGIAKRLGGPASADGTTRTREATFEYAAPEQIRGHVVGARADVYALGITLYELFTRRRPYEASGISAADVEASMRAAYPPTVGRGFRADTRRDLDALIGKATAISPETRYTNVEEMRRDIQCFLERRPLSARNAGVADRARKFVRRRWKELAITMVLATSATTGVALHNRALAASRDVAIAEAARTTRLRQYLEDLFKGGSSTIRPLDSIRVATLVENGIREARGLTTDPELQGEALLTLASMSQRMGDLDRADTLFRAAIDQGTSMYGDHHPEVLRARVRRALLTSQRQQPDSAQAELYAADSLAHRFAPTAHPVIAEADAALGLFLRSRDRFPLAIQFLKQAAAEERSRDSVSREYAVALRELGNAISSSGNPAGADSLWLQALPLVRRLFGPRHPDVAFLLSNLGTTAAQRGKFADAERYQREAVSINADWYGPSHYLTAATNGALAQTLLRLGKIDEAIPMLHNAIDGLANAPDVGSAAITTNILRTSVAVALGMKGDHRAAVGEYERAIAGLVRIEGPTGKSTIAATGNLALELAALGRVDSAVAMLRRAERTASDAYGDSSVVVAQVRVELGDALLQRHAPSEAVRSLVTGLSVLDKRIGSGAALARNARKHLVAAYVALGDSANAARVQGEIDRSVAASAKAAPSGKKSN